jgi:predicted HAD superfamily hydrolase
MLKQMIADERIKVVSFDIFDTLVLRPVVKPTDMFFLLDEFYKNNIDNTSTIKFSDVRKNTEHELIKRRIESVAVNDVSLDNIYAEISKQLLLNGDQTALMMEREIAVEIDLAYRNDEMFELINYARKQGKRTIVTSDMYLSLSVIKKILDKLQIKCDAMYISSEIGKRKDDDGTLFDYILEKECILPHELLHIGDNEHSDVIMPLNKGIIAYQYNPYFLTRKKSVEADESTSFILGYLFNKEKDLKSNEYKKYTNLYDFGYYYFGPAALSIALYILHLKEIQDNYTTIFFTSRDGYFHHIVYEYLRNVIHKGKEGKYIYCGRKALSIAEYHENVIEFLEVMFNKITYDATDKEKIKYLFKGIGISDFYKEDGGGGGD